ncbi:MAG: colanic acid biosynthesis glycosyltransferase WcaL [Richelia sp. RM2_1_2]|nr:colanic acid biosynthesis glycosyltransferase WcaL [Richelia sp. SM1_7_0]NJO27909.1 colanic acid biosynthesis glycosyltransferase WcaL [Richelia sp. SL_2_1]NJO58379.1 colanic acid biosynthesis glycosyltransferase WcaL [Richelia sp. RM2_1_2]
MKIAFIVDKFPVLSETFVINQITGLIERGHEVHIYGRQTDDSKLHPDVEKYKLIEHTRYLPEISKNYLWRLLNVIYLLTKNFSQAPLVLLRSLNIFKYGKRAASLRLFYSTLPFLNAPEYDIIHCQFGRQAVCKFGPYTYEGIVLRDIGAVKGKLLTTFRGYDISWYLHQYGEKVYDELFQKGDFFYTNCEFFRQRAIQLGCDEKKIIVHGSGIDCSRFRFQARYPDDSGLIRIATTGRLIEKKGIEYAIRAIAEVVKVYPNVEFNIIGDGELKEHFAQIIQELNIADKVHLKGWRNQKEIISILDETHIFVAPSVTASDGNQDAPVNTLKEAMAMGLPVIGTLHGGIPELIEDGISGFLVPERDASAIADKLIYLIEHPEIWQQMGLSGRKKVEMHYDINKLNSELVEIYQLISSNDLYLSKQKRLLSSVSPNYI